MDLRQLELAGRERLTDWQGLLEREGDEARAILGAALVGRFVFSPGEDASGPFYDYLGRWSVGKALAGVLPVASTKGMVTPAGFEPAISTLKGSRPWPG